MVIDGRRSLVLDNGVSRLVVDLLGGSFVEFQFRDQRLNPLVWNNAGDPDEPRQMSHFLCLDRWGWPSDAEARNGMPYHGEASLVEWQVVEEPCSDRGFIHTVMQARLPIAGLEVRRSIHFSADNAFFTVTEEVTNNNRLGSVLNMVQHPSIGPPFLDENTVVDANAARGFVLSNLEPNPETRAVVWPQALAGNGEPVNMRYLRDDQDPNVVAYVIDDDLGWVTASNAACGLLIGYAWKTSDYPWFNAWRRVDDAKPFARGLEFGTTGLDWPHGDLVRKGQIFGRSLFVHLDAGETLSKSFTCFLLRIPADYIGVGAVRHSGENLKVVECRSRGARETRLNSVPQTAILPKR